MGHVYNQLLRQKHPYVPKNAPKTPFFIQRKFQLKMPNFSQKCHVARHALKIFPNWHGTAGSQFFS